MKAKESILLSTTATIVCTLGVIANFVSYATKVDKGTEYDLLNSASAYVQHYNGETPREPLEYAQRTLAIVGKREAFREEANKLEKEIQGITVQIGDSKIQSIYQPVLKNIGNEIDKVSYGKVRSGWELWGGAISGIGLLTGLFGLGYELRRKKKENEVKP